MLLTDGTVLVKTTAGDTDAIGNTWDRLTPDASGSYINGTWSTIAPMHFSRLYFSTQVLPDGRLYVAGGEYGSGMPYSEVYNPLTDTWTNCPHLSTSDTFDDANSELLYNGKILQAAQISSGSRANYIYNPTTNTYVAGPNSLGNHDESAWLKLPDSSILFVNLGSLSSERYIPSTNTWVSDGAVPDSLYDPYAYESGGAFLLPNGKGFFIGSTNHTAYYTPSGNTSPGTWSAGPDMPNHQGQPDAPSAMLVNGKILLAVSHTPTSSTSFDTTTKFYEFDYTSNTYTLTTPPGGIGDSLPIATYVNTFIDLPDGTVLYSQQGNNQYYVYTPTGSALAAGKPTVTGTSQIDCENYKVTGTLFNGISEGASYGDDWQMATNYPIVRLTSGTNVYYCRSTNWNRVGAVMTGTAPDTAQFTLPAGLPAGTYSLQVIANGIPSSVYSFTPATGRVASITGGTTIDVGGTTTLSDSVSGGVWSSSAATIATVSATGTVTGMALGTAVISYTITSACGTSTATTIINVAHVASTGGYCTPSFALDSISCAEYGLSITQFKIIGAAGTTLNDVSSCTGHGYEDKTSLSVTLDRGATYIATLASGSSGYGMDAQTWIDFNDDAVFEASESVGGLNYYASTGNTDTLTIPATATTGIHRMRLVTSYDGYSYYYPYLDPCTVGYEYGDARDYMVNIVSSSACSGTPTYGTISATVTQGCALPITTTIDVSGATSGTGITYKWQSSADSSTWTTIGGATTTDYTTTVASSPTYYRLLITCSSSGLSTTTAGIKIELMPAPTAGTISGPTSVCVGSNATLSESVSGGVWSSATTSIATVTSAGVVTGVATGTDSIAYTVTNACGVSAVKKYGITVTTAPVAGTISGGTTVCTGSTLSLVDGAGGGTWSSLSTSLATVTAVGLVTGVAAGIDTIEYSVTNGCGTATAKYAVTVSAGPGAGTISGTTTFCAGATSSLTDGVSGGTWTSTNNSIATVNSSGLVTGVAAGTDTIYYSVTSGCGTTSASSILTINALPNAGTITGAVTMCTGTTTSLSDGVSGGTWSSSATGTATVTAAGLVTAVATGSVTITYTVANSCGTATTTHNIVITTTATAGTITGNVSVCPGSLDTLSDGTAGGTWTSATTSVATVSATGVVTGVTVGTTVISYGVTSSCGTAYTTYSVAVLAAPSAGTISGSSTLCIGATTTLTDGVSGGTWSSSSTATATVNSTGTVTGVANGTTLISYTVTNACGSATTTKSVTVNLTASGGTITGATSVCAGSTTTLIDGTSGGVWTSSSTAVATVTAGGMVTGVSAGSVTISYGVTSSCGTATATYTITVNPLPNAGTITGATSVCRGSTITLTDAAGGGTWSSSTTTVATVGATGIVSGVTAGSTTITYSVTNGCGTATALYSVAVTTAASAGTITGAVSLCAGASTTLTDGATGGTWSSSATGTATVSATGIVTGVTGGAVTISYTVTTACGSAFATYNITINPLPSAGSITGATSVCTGSTITVADAAGGGAWSSTATSVATVNASGVVTGVATGTTSINYTVTNSCGTVSASQTITVLATPSVAPVSGGSVACIGATLSLADGTTGGSWTSGTTTVATVNASGVVTAVTAGTSIITYNVTNICGTSSAYDTVTSTASPTVGAISGGSTLCAGVTMSLTDAIAGGTWTSSSAAVATVGSTSGVVTGVAAGTVNITYTITNGCGSAATIHTVTISTVPGAGTISGPSVICAGGTITLTDGVSGGVWSSGATAIATTGGTGVITGVAGGTATISYGVSGACGTGYATATVTVYPDPYAGIISGTSTLCTGATTTLVDTVTGGTWSTGSSAIATVSSTGVVTAVGAGTVNIIYSYTNPCGTVISSHTITVSAPPAAGTITGVNHLCAGSHATFTGSVAGTDWAASNGNATVSTGGVVIAISEGIDTIYHIFINGCGADSAMFIDTVDSRLTTGAIGSRDTLCPGDTINLTTPVPYGLWFSSNGNATVDSAGQLIGVLPGLDTITYSVINACGSSSANLIVKVNPTSLCGTTGINTPVAATEESLNIAPNPNQGSVVLNVISASNARATITITNMVGEKMQEFNVSTNIETPVDIHVPAGMYFITATTNDKKMVSKIIVE